MGVGCWSFGFKKRKNVRAIEGGKRLSRKREREREREREKRLPSNLIWSIYI